ncbi:biotin--[acetyl-CoA-carboxylase] ligase [Caldibacillus thermolactis]|uniref:Bifunctional ligase/repressor BirA n=1 Tax=Pallidibacillus thermolactis TaxID=251051 RepID=A0ABT2WDC4_9BACI|nr:biotin--[acetyl-CoA-carboxylase] ligase [Pallidibacillus thermolactis]MCU9593679.1 biotin--[acetyl-CoA-carboxylase] ligase [Pallidibacillus thermolactis]MCU9599821.1 biotin--[acetyl-CoA-carboxylase] ligase [Pallidibacillus thermolactis subsp. kokeshiiformis]MED1673848.1 biotin--[acetyl-CoA-carboxylase] ligase [Pallidibacillus thermolactis subsp. kokeshiiformis]
MKSNVRQALLDAFKNANGKFISGEKLAQNIGCSRTAIWKHIEDLKKDGFHVEAVRKKGYRLLEQSNKLSENEIYLGLETEEIGRSVYFFESVTSTQKVAKEYAMNGAKHGTLIVADEQTEGRGRMVRKWYSPKGTGIWASFILRPDIQIQHAPQLTLLSAVAVVQAIKKVTHITPEIKWPNDILISGRKVCGILTELQAEEDRIQSVILGIGINVNQDKNDFSAEIIKKATSLKIELGKTVNRSSLIQSLCYYIEQLLHLYISEGFTPIKSLWETYAVSIGKRISARTVKGTFDGVALGINNEGVLLLKQDNGDIVEIISADIDFA